MNRLEKILSENLKGRETLCPGRETAINSEFLETKLKSLLQSEGDWRAFEDFLLGFILTLQENFPGNLFYDLDYFLWSIVRTSKEEEFVFQNELQKKKDLIQKIFTTFGIHSKIKFQYAHDFLYGYDWCKWVREKQLGEKDITPFGYPFLLYILGRGKDMLQLVESDSLEYPSLEANSKSFRNPFLFQRSPSQEALVMRSLASEGKLPVLGWDLDFTPAPEVDFLKIRFERAQDLGISENRDKGAHKI